ncbi:MAG: DUF4393 domain-containing protein [Gammaproteobacteria bacterium]
MCPLPDFIEKLLPQKVVERLYEDGVSDSAKELSKIGVDLAKTARLFLAPFQLTGAFQDRFERFVRRVAEEVPEARRIEPPPELVGPSLAQMQYLDEDNPLWKMFETLLTSAIDSDKVDLAHPSFAHIISQLARDEAVILYHLRNRDFRIVDRMDLIREENRFENRVVEESDIPEGELFLPEQMHVYYSHLESLSLVTWPVTKQDPIHDDNGTQTGIRRYSTMQLTEFGRLFVSACVPDKGFKT